MSNFVFHFKHNLFLKNIVEISNTILNDVNLFFSKDGIEMNAMDASHISLIHFFLEKEHFKEISISSSNIIIGIHIKTLQTLLKCWKPGDELILSYCGDSTLQLTLKEKEQQYVFSIPILNIEQDTVCIPKDITFDAEFEMTSVQFFSIMKNLATIGGMDIEFESIGKIINIKSSGDLGSVCLIKEFKKEDIQISKNLNIKVSSRYLNPFSRGYLLSDKVKVGMTEENPLLLHYSLGNKSYIQFFIAPKFDDE